MAKPAKWLKRFFEPNFPAYNPNPRAPITYYRNHSLKVENTWHQLEGENSALLNLGWPWNHKLDSSGTYHNHEKKSGKRTQPNIQQSPSAKTPQKRPLNVCNIVKNNRQHQRRMAVVGAHLVLERHHRQLRARLVPRYDKTKLKMSTIDATSISNSSSVTNCSSICVANDPPSSDKDEFPVQNVVGIFLTLSLCLLTQPYGSLFYNPPSSKGGQRLFFAWRLNPLACIAERPETAVIIVSLFLVLRLAMQDPKHNTLPSLSSKFLFYLARTEKSRNWRRHWHLHAAALLLIRANEEGDGNGSEGVLDRLLAESLSRDDGSGEELGAVVTTGRGSSGTGDSMAGGGGEGAHTSEPQLGVLRRRTSQLEADSNVTTHGQDRLADLRKVLGSNVLAHKEKWVNLVTSFSVLGVAIKLAATTLPWTVRVPAAFFLAGWSSVQFLLYLFHLGELDESSAETVLKTIRLHRQLGKDPTIQGGIRCLVALVVAPPVEACSWGTLLLASPSVGILLGSLFGACKSFMFLVYIEGVVRFFNGLIGAGTMILTSYALFMLLVGTCRLMHKKKAQTMSPADEAVVAVAAAFNALFCLYLFGELVYNYNSTDTYKPAWLEYLG
ncbi:hypothetical protein V8F20_010957 [Naviculisporaceae sp. PSN 640]